MKYLNNKQSLFSGAYLNLTGGLCRPNPATALNMPMVKNGDTDNSGSGSNGNSIFAGAGLAIIGC